MRSIHAPTLAAFVATVAISSHAFAQPRWQFDDSASSVNIIIQGFADEGPCGRAAGQDFAFFPDPNDPNLNSPHPGPWTIDPLPLDPGFPPPQAHAGWLQFDRFQSGGVSLQCFTGATALGGDRRAGDGLVALDGSRFPCVLGLHPSFAESSPYASVLVRGVGRRTLEVRWISHVTNEVLAADGYVARGCADLSATLATVITNVDPNELLRVRYAWRVFGFADADHEMPRTEDNERADLDASIDFFNSGVPGGIVSEFVDEDAGTASLDRSGDDIVFITPGGAADIPVRIDLNSFAFATSKRRGVPQGVQEEDDSGAEFCAILTITTFQRVEPPPMRRVPGGDLGTGIGSAAGPAYDFDIGQFEVTNLDYTDFLNDAELDAGATERSSNMVFDVSTGTVYTPIGLVMFATQSGTPTSRIRWNAADPVGSRYTIEPGYEVHPAVGMSWYGAVKYCNWLTIASGLPAGERCYAEGSGSNDWHPMTITTADWITRDLNTAERQALVDNFEGYRLPMDDLGTATGFVGNQGSAFNEWYKAKAFDPAAPAFDRVGPGGETVPAFHWTYGFGRDTIGSADANYLSSGDPFDNGTAEVGYFDGAELLANGLPTASTTNPWGLFDLSGNVREWGQDKVASIRYAVHTSAWGRNATDLAASTRNALSRLSTADDVGMRVLRVPGTPFCFGDINGDGVINLTDLARLLAAFGTSAGDPLYSRAADLNGDGRVDLSDLAALLARFGTPCP
ncbi:MAG: SUMF1/EgtB/PvdO family nonheme iron enzyme [Phycisphaerae bacterium]